MSEDSNPVKYMDMDEFRDAGFLQEANRRFFHPLGIALEWNDGWTREGLSNFLVNVMRREAAAAAEDPEQITIEDVHPITIEMLWRFISEAGLDKPRISGVWDYRDDPEGVVFSWEHMPRDEIISKAMSVTEEFVKHLPARRALLGEEGMELSSVLVTSIQSLPKP